jgi:hypothetical protein
MAKKAFVPGARVTWFADEDYWGEVEQAQPAPGDVLVRWQDAEAAEWVRRDALVIRMMPRPMFWETPGGVRVEVIRYADRAPEWVVTIPAGPGHALGGRHVLARTGVKAEVVEALAAQGAELADLAEGWEE